MVKKQLLLKSKLSKYLYILPLILLVIFVYIYPIGRSVNYSFFNLPFGTAKGVFIGIKNYVNILNDGIFWISLKNNFVWALSNLIIQLTLASIIAAILNARFRGRNIVRSVVLIPWIIPTVAIACVIRWVLLPNLGIANELLRGIHIIKEPINFLGNDNAMMTLILLNSWKSIPIGILLVLSALQTIPKDLYESAQADGATALQQYFHITFPLINKMLWYASFIIFVWSFNTFDIIWLITQGGPGEITQTLPIMVYRAAFKSMRLGESSAIAIIIAIILGVIGAVYFTVVSRRSKNEKV